AARGAHEDGGPRARVPRRRRSDGHGPARGDHHRAGLQGGRAAVRALVRKAWAFLPTYHAYILAYRAALVLWALASSLPFILVGAWLKAAEGGDFGKSPGELARYFLAAFIVRQVTVVWVIWEFEHDVVKGRLSSQLLMPIDP